MDLVPANLSPSPRSVPPRGSPAVASGSSRFAAAASRPAMRPPVRAPETLHPALWLGHQLGRSGDDALSSGFPLLDAQLPGGGWPRRCLSELLLPHPGIGEIRLLAPALVAAQRAGRLVMFFDPPAALSAAALVRFGFDIEELLIVHTCAHVTQARSDSLWALEQALKSGHVGAVLAWLPPRLHADRLRRLQLAAHQHDGPAFVLRETEVAGRPTASPLRLHLRAGGADRLEVDVLKRRGPPLEVPLRLALPPVLSRAARQRSESAVERPPVLQQATFVNFA